jgi:hypothetical protein
LPDAFAYVWRRLKRTIFHAGVDAAASRCSQRRQPSRFARPLKGALWKILLLPAKKLVDLLHSRSGFNPEVCNTKKEKAPMSKPSHIAYVVKDAKESGKPGIWRRVGSVWPHKNGSGFDVLIDEQISVSGRIVCTEPKEKETNGE